MIFGDLNGVQINNYKLRLLRDEKRNRKTRTTGKAIFKKTGDSTEITISIAKISYHTVISDLRDIEERNFVLDEV